MLLIFRSFKQQQLLLSRQAPSGCGVGGCWVSHVGRARFAAATGRSGRVAFVLVELVLVVVDVVVGEEELLQHSLLSPDFGCGFSQLKSTDDAGGRTMCS